MGKRILSLVILIVFIIGLITIYNWYQNSEGKVVGFYSSVLQSDKAREQEVNLYLLSKLMNKKVIIISDDSVGLDNNKAFSNNFMFEPILILRTEENTRPYLDSFTIKKNQLDSINRLNTARAARLPGKNIQTLALLVERQLDLFEIEKGRFVIPDQKGKKIIYVKPGGTGNGRSWQRALGDLQAALKAAKKGDQIWVAVGKYLPTKGTDRTASFRIPDGVQLYGGFAGTEKDLYARDWQARPTVLSGEIGTASPDDNSYSVVYTQKVSNLTVVDGFTITGGTANGFSEKGAPDRCGAGWYNDGSRGESSPVIVNCIFTKNYSRDGAGLYNYAQNGKTNPVLQNCRFIANRADLDGGAIHNNGSNGTASPILDGCLFQNNEAAYGAGIFNGTTDGQSKPLITNCNFIGNLAYISGSSIYNSKDYGGVSEAIVQNCRFEQNASGVKQPEVQGTGRK
jgi:hypothetical protein